MNATRVGGANPISHIMSRQIGDNIVSFRQNLFRERLANAQNLYRMNMIAHYGCVNAIEFSKNGNLLTSGKFFFIFTFPIGILNETEELCESLLLGGDDRRVLLWKLEESMAGVAEPQAMNNQHYSNIFCLGFNNDSTKIFSGGNDDAVIVHDVKT